MSTAHLRCGLRSGEEGSWLNSLGPRDQDLIIPLSNVIPAGFLNTEEFIGIGMDRTDREKVIRFNKLGLVLLEENWIYIKSLFNQSRWFKVLNISSWGLDVHQ